MGRGERGAMVTGRRAPATESVGSLYIGDGPQQVPVGPSSPLPCTLFVADVTLARYMVHRSVQPGRTSVLTVFYVLRDQGVLVERDRS